VGVSSSYRLFRPTVVRFGQAVDLSAYQTEKLTSEILRSAGDIIMAAIRNQLDGTVRNV